MFAYIYVYDHWKLFTLPWNSPWTWLICFIGVDFCYYWFHRMAHEVNVIWAAHQVHHSSEEYNFTTALRQSVVQNYTSIVFYLPLALAVPPPMYMVHSQFNLLYQFWIHTEIVHSLGPLEYILNTPSHHRVHHGRNRYCIDKNYGGTLIIWDRLFGTFTPETEEVVYGLTHPVASFDPNYIQWCHYMHILRMTWVTPGLLNKLWVLLKGPGWVPGKSRLGCIEDIPDVHAPAEKYDPGVPAWCNLYCMLHMAITVLHYDHAVRYREEMSAVLMLVLSVHFVYTLTCFGALFDHRNRASLMEFGRCLYCVVAAGYLEVFPPEGALAMSTLLCRAVHFVFVASLLLWGMQSLRHEGFLSTADDRRKPAVTHTQERWESKRSITTATYGSGGHRLNVQSKRE
ncbi:PREDICTED: alkylglycerol monooxygenase-like isoform X2 [Priapulus caudatus]|nr:PREDICTED: alkylglycerol monooxygenase-like isoform X2 [Priapulus caudatus]